VVSLEQVRALEDRVEKAVAFIASLREEGAELRRRLAEAQSFIDEAGKELADAELKVQAAEARASEAATRKDSDAAKVRELEARVADMAQRVAAAETRAAELAARAEEYRKDQAKIEEGIVHALAKLDSFEDLVLSQTSTSAAPEPVRLHSGSRGKALAQEPAGEVPADPRDEIPAPVVAEPAPAHEGPTPDEKVPAAREAPPVQPVEAPKVAVQKGEAAERRADRGTKPAAPEPKGTPKVHASEAPTGDASKPSPEPAAVREGPGTLENELDIF